MSAYYMPRRYPIAAIHSCWRYYAQRPDGTLDERTVIDAEPADTTHGYWPAFITHDGVRVVLITAQAAPTAVDARRTLCDLLWHAYCDGAIALPLPLPSMEEVA